MNTKGKISLIGFFILALFITSIFNSVYSQEVFTVNKLKVQDWWIVKIDQMAIWKRAADSSWVDAGEWKFVVRAKKNQKMIVDVTNIKRPKDSQPWKLTIVYDNNGSVIDATYKVGDRTFTGETALKILPIGKEGLFIGHSLEKIRAAPTTTILDVQTREVIKMPKIIFEETDAFQLWRDTDPWWRYFEKKQGLPIKAKLINTSWWH